MTAKDWLVISLWSTVTVAEGNLDEHAQTLGQGKFQLIFGDGESTLCLQVWCFYIFGVMATIQTVASESRCGIQL